MLKQTKKTEKGLEEWEHQPCLEEACSLFYGKKNKCSLFHNSEATNEMRRILERVDFISSFQVIQSGVEGIHSDLSQGLRAQRQELENGQAALQEKVSGLSDGWAEGLKAQQDELARRQEQVQEQIAKLTSDLSGEVTETLAKRVDEVQKTLQALGGDSQKHMESFAGRVDSLEGSVSGNLELWRDESGEMIASLKDRLVQLEEHSQDSMRQLKEIKAQAASDQATLVAKVENFMEETRGLLKELVQGNGVIHGYFEEHRKFTEDEGRRRKKESAREHNNRGVVYFHKGAHEAAALAFEKSVELDPEYAEAYNNLGLVYTELNRSDHAEKAFENALVLRPDLVEAYNNLGILYYAETDYDKATEMFSKALSEGCRDRSAAYTNFGNSLHQLQQYEEAAEAWTRALQINPLNQNAKKGLALLKHQEQGI
jgi:tetratricopeptide (TPR) repeat protein